MTIVLFLCYTLLFMSGSATYVVSYPSEPIPMTTAAISGFKMYSYYAAAAYCSPDSLKSWTCGSNCNANLNYMPVAAGGNGNSIQNWFVGYDSALRSVIVGHQGTDPLKLLSVLTDLNALQVHLPASFVAPSAARGNLTKGSIRTAPLVLSAVNTSLTQFSTNQVTIVGHSLGAALSLLDAAYLRSVLGTSTNIKVVTYGMPRVGNSDFAAWIDSNIPDLHRINNRRDPVPIVPGIGLGYAHPSGEIHITEQNAWLACTGEDSIQAGCTIADNDNVFTAHVPDHLGPYDEVFIGKDWC